MTPLQQQTTARQRTSVWEGERDGKRAVDGEGGSCSHGSGGGRGEGVGIRRGSGKEEGGEVVGETGAMVLSTDRINNCYRS